MTNVDKNVVLVDGQPLYVKNLDVEALVAALSTMNMRDQSAVYRQLKDRRSLVDKYSKEMKQVLDNIEALLLEGLIASGTKRVTFEGIGTVQSRTSLKYSMDDPDLFYEFIRRDIEEKTMQGTPNVPFSFFSKSVSQATTREFLESQAVKSLEVEPFPSGTLEANLPHEDQVMERVKSIAATYGILVYEQTDASVVK